MESNRISKATIDRVQYINEEVETWIGLHRTIMNPPIRGEITPGKLKWRGIKVKNDGDLYWLEQRGKRFGSLLEIKV